MISKANCTTDFTYSANVNIPGLIKDRMEAYAPAFYVGGSITILSCIIFALVYLVQAGRRKVLDINVNAK